MNDSPTPSEPDNTAKPAPKHRNLQPPWKKGQSGNPNGRPRTAEETKSVRFAARQHTAEALTTLTHIAAKGKSESARVAAACALLDRGWGKSASSPADRALREKIHRERLDQEMGIIRIKQERAEQGLPNDSFSVTAQLPPPTAAPVPEWMKRMGMMDPNVG